MGLKKSRRAYRIDNDLLRNLINPNKSGAYILGTIDDGSFQPKYVGRSDSCLLTRILNHNHREKVTHVEWEIWSSPKKSYDRECSLYHNLLEQESLEIFNEIHPASPLGLGLNCKVCSIKHTEILEIFKERGIDYEDFLD